ncbi:MAG: class I SAM-dependent RNA methyltransferase [Dehalococcoidia bacterium]|nr:class I SAM-dependent RNA methyltransferase [Dehalococcoidia bacterium]
MTTSLVDEPAAFDPGAPDASDDAVAGPARRDRAGRGRRKRRLVDQPRVPITLELTGFAHGGYALGRAPDGRIVFASYGVPGERVVAEITAEAPSYIEATVVQVLEASPHRVTARCQYFGPGYGQQCGGCQLQHIEYGEQVRLKTEVVRDQLRRIGKFEDAPVLPMLGQERPWEYRNHMRFTVRRDGDVGFMQRGTHRFLKIELCPIALPQVNRALAGVQGRTFGTRQLSVRVGEHTEDELIQPTLQWRPGRTRRVRSGQPFLREELLGQRYRVSASAFFQVNTRQAEVLVAYALDRLLERQPNVVVDAYSGVGTFAALVAPHVDRVITIEAQTAAGDDAEVNLGQLRNVTRTVGDVARVLPGMDPSPDALVIDPPRAGVERAVLHAIIESTTRRVVYVSCEPATLARDLRILVDAGFALLEVQPVDMFPQTQHIECVAVLDRPDPRIYGRG